MKILIPLLAISLFSVGSYAASAVGVTQETYQAQNGVLYNIAGGFTASSNGFTVVPSSAAASSQPATWTSGGTAQTALTQGDWEFSVTLTIAASAATSHTYTLSVQWNTGSSYVSLGTLTLTTPSSITPGQTMTFYMDTGVTTFNAPAAIIVTVA
jgi:hypothetical protein